MKKLMVLMVLMAVILIAGTAAGVSAGGYYYYWFTIVDEQGNLCASDIDVNIQKSATNITLYKDPAGASSYTDSNGFSFENLDGGYVSFWCKYQTVDVILGDGTNTMTRSSITGSDNKLLFSQEGWTMTALTVTGAVTAGGAITGNGDWVIGNAITDDVTISGALLGATPLYFDGATDNTNETAFGPQDDPAGDIAVTFPNTVAGTLLTSSLTTNDIDVANSIWGATNMLCFGGLTGADGFELQVKPNGDPAADKILYLPVTTDAAAMVSSLATNDVDVANSVWGGTNMLCLGGATGADGFELQLKPMGDPAADKYVLFPVLNNCAAMISTLTTNDVDIINSVWCASNGIVLEGATADAYETIISPDVMVEDVALTTPSKTGGIVAVVSQSATQTSQAGAAVSDVTGSSLSLAAGWMTAGKTLEFTLGGTKTGANAAMKVHLYLSDGAVMTLTADDATAVDWTATFTIYEYTDAAHQKIVGQFKALTADPAVDYAAATKDCSGAVTIKCQIESQNAGDTVTCEYVNVKTWTK